MLERASTLLARLNEVFDDDNRAALASTLDNIDRATKTIAEEGPAIRSAIREAEGSLRAFQAAADQFGTASQSVNAMVNEDGRPLIADLRKSSQQLNETLGRLDKLVGAAEPGVQTLSTQTVPELNRLIIDLRDMSGQLGAIAGKLDEGPLGSVVGGRSLPDYQPEKKRK